MRRKVTKATLEQFMKELAAAARSRGNVYFTVGATALLLGFRDQTIDIDLKLDPEPGGVFEAIAELKNRLNLNVELAAPDDFIPNTPDWRGRSQHIASIGQVQFFHYDFALQALAKLERGQTQDMEDVANFIRRGHVTTAELLKCFTEIEPNLLRYPALDPIAFKKRLEEFLMRFKP